MNVSLGMAHAPAITPAVLEAFGLSASSVEDALTKNQVRLEAALREKAFLMEARLQHAKEHGND